MNKIKFLFFALSLAIGFNGFSEMTIPLYPEDIDPTEEIPGYTKRRTPPAPIMCFIDIEAGTVMFSSLALDEIDSYQIYDESGEICIGIYDTPAEFTAALTNLSGDYTLKFLTPQGTYTAHITL